MILVTGPRQVGKTTLLRQLADKTRGYVTLDDPAVRALAQADPALFLERFEPPVLIDEIQYAPQLLPLIKMAVDKRRRNGLFWLTGSQQFHLMKGVSETLAGRVAILSLLGFSNRERRRCEFPRTPFLPTKRLLKQREASAPALTLKRLYADIWSGSFPALVTKQVRDRDLFYSSYLQTYLQRDVKDLTQVGNEASFIRFLRACAAHTGQMLNLTDLACDVAVYVDRVVVCALRPSHYCQPDSPWYRSKRDASFADMLTTLRCESVREQVLSTPPSRRGNQKLLATLMHAVQQAA